MKKVYIAPLSVGIAFSAEPILASGISGVGTHEAKAGNDFTELSRQKSSSENPIWKDMN